ncbi:DNA gyrase subunit A, chloroplastic/mitochondrial [Linum perenne]
MATNIPPHNLGEIVDVLCALIHNPEATLQELLEYMPGPDFPTGGLIMGNLGLHGELNLFPFKLQLKRGAEPALVLNNLYRLTPLQSSFSCNMVSILDGQPKQMGLKEMLKTFLDFRCSVVERRARFKLSQAQDRRHIVEGIVVGLDNLDHIIQVIKESSNNSAACSNLVNEFNISQKQAEAILDISLRRLNHLERSKYVDERQSLIGQISKLEELLASKEKMLHLIEQEALELKNTFSNPRRSMLEYFDDGQLDDIDAIPNEEILMAISEKGYVKRMKPNTFNLQRRGTVGKSVGKLRVNDAMSDFVVCRSHDHILYFRCFPFFRFGTEDGESDEQVVLVSQSGTVNRIKVRDISIQSRYARGVILMRLDYGGKIQSASLIPATEDEEQTEDEAESPVSVASLAS